MRKRYQQGSVTKSSDGRYWVAKYRVGGQHRTKLLGKLRKMSKTEAQEKFAEIIKPQVDAPAETTVEHFVEHVFLPFCRKRWKPITSVSRTDSIKRHIVGAWGCQRIGEAFEVNRRSRPMSGHVAHAIHQALRAATIDVRRGRTLEQRPQIEGAIGIAVVVVDDGLVIVALLGANANDEADRELEKLHGKWVLVSVETKGQTLPKDKIVQNTLVISGEYHSDPSTNIFLDAVTVLSGGVMIGYDGGQSGAQQAIIGSGKEEGGSEAGIGDAVTVTVGDALDHAVEA